MKTKSKQLLLFITCLLGILWSCEKEIPYKGDDSESLLVVNQLIEKDSTFSIEIERSKFFLEQFSVNTSINDALIVLKNITTGASETQAVGNNGLYDFTMVAQEGHSYEVTVNHANYPTASANTTIPVSVPLISVDTMSFDNPNNEFNSEKVMEAKLRWNDPVGKNYYVITVKLDQGNYSESMFIGSNDLSITNNGESFEGEKTYDYFFALNDETFDGAEKELTLQFDYFFSGIGTQYTYQLYNCSEDAYKYLVSVNTGSNSGGPFSEPVKIHKNIEGGYGIFSGINKSQIIK